MKAAQKPKPERPLLAEATGVGEAAFLILHSDFERFRRECVLVLESEDPEAVHDMRVAIRRMRAALETFKPFLPATVIEQDKDLQWVFQRLGTLRDLDIQIAKITDWTVHEHPGSEAIRCLTERLLAERKRARSGLVRALNSSRFKELDEGLNTLIADGPTAKKGLTAVPLLAVAPDLVRRTYKKAAAAASGLNPDSPASDFHKLRKQAKKLRYALEFFRELYAKPAENLISHLKEVQDVLGARQDDIVARNHLQELASKNGLSKQAKALIAKIGKHYQAEAKTLENNFTDLSQQTFGRPWRALQKEMESKRRSLWK